MTRWRPASAIPYYLPKESKSAAEQVQWTEHDQVMTPSLPHSCPSSLWELVGIHFESCFLFSGVENASPKIFNVGFIFLFHDIFVVILSAFPCKLDWRKTFNILLILMPRYMLTCIDCQAVLVVVFVVVWSCQTIFLRGPRLEKILFIYRFVIENHLFILLCGYHGIQFYKIKQKGLITRSWMNA